MTEEYHEQIYGFMRERFFNETGIYLADLSLPEQAALMFAFEDDCKNLDGHSIQGMYQVFKEKGIDMARALMSDKKPTADRMKGVLLVAMSLDDADAKRVFKEHTQLLQFSQQVHRVIAPHIQAKIGGGFDEDDWMSEVSGMANGYLTAVIEVCSQYFEFEDVPTPSMGDDGLEEKIRRMREKATGRETDIYWGSVGRINRVAWKQAAKNHPDLAKSSAYEAILEKVAVDLANQFSAEEVKGVLQELPEHIARLLVPYLQPETPGEVKEDLKRLYEGIRFEGYDLNKKMTPVELARLHAWLPKGKPVLDAGCGTGRLLVPLAKLGFDIHGFDYTPRHVRVVQEELASAGLNPARVQEGDWLATPYQEESFEVVSCLGRNILHEYRLERQKKFFAEMNRILKPGGKLIIDIPDATIPSSHYAELTNGYTEVMRKRGIKNTRPGTIFDSPDNKNFATRHVYSDMEIHRFAREAGFEIAAVESEDLPTGQGDKNIYYTLRKVRSLEAQDMAQAA